MGGGGGGVVEVIKSKGCSRLLVGISSPLNSFRGLQPVEPMSPASSSSLVSGRSVVRSAAPFLGLVICVTGLSKEARKQVMEATERLGARLSESNYSVKSFGENAMPLDEWNRLTGFSGAENSCLPVGVRGSKQSCMVEEPLVRFSGRETDRRNDYTLSGHSMYVDLDTSAELRNKVIEAASREGATLLDKWFVGCHASHVVCEGSSIRRYLGHASNLVTPLWVLKTAKEKYVQRLVHMSADLARQVNLMLEDFHSGIAGEPEEVVKARSIAEDASSFRNKANYEERQRIANSAKIGVRNRRGRRMQTCQTPMRPITPTSLLDSICWSISEPTSTAAIYTDSLSSEGASEQRTPQFFDAKGDAKDSEASFANLTRPLTESEKSEVVFRNNFLTILFPVDRFSEVGPSSRTFFSDGGFTCLQENMSVHEIEAAIHTDSKHADRLRSVYSSKETADHGYVIFKRIDFLGSRRSFEMLKRVSGDNNSNVYELLIRA
ncbi:hypothetical protein TIFTF001_032404 [Ficus carica]|uniref:BRCT domain-containing protein n=1 Tax=Ficus carica TaxID=3494 RepID=A0AA88J7W0_FICCA|nr:hypothetical protein TIFTF001_032404 [Ficus carica]